MHKQRLELDWVGKNDEPTLEPRILLKNIEHSLGTPSGNMLIHGDNLLALKALESDFSGKIRCIYIDPPYNTGQAFEHYDDGLEHSLWLSLMRDRLLLLKKLLTQDGVLFVQLDDNEVAYCKVLLDEIFGRNNFINQVSVKTKPTAGASGGGEDKRLKKNIEYILIYVKDSSEMGFDRFNDVFEEKDLFKHIEEMREDGKSWKYTRILKNMGTRTPLGETADGSGQIIKIYRHDNYEMIPISQEVKRLIKNGQSKEDAERKVYLDNYETIFRDTNAQSSIRTRVMESVGNVDGLFSIDYIPRSGRNKGQQVTVYYKGEKKDQIAWLKDICEKTRDQVIIKERVGTLWDDFNWNNVSKEGNVVFPNGKKPETLIERCILLASDPGDYVLDSFAGSGTTGAAAHKMGRKWIMVELRDHCFTHIIPRLQRVISGDDRGGISEKYSWNGGGGYEFYELAPSLLQKDSFGNWVFSPKYNAFQLAEAVCKHEGFKFWPDQNLYWKQGFSTEKDFIFVTTEFLTADSIERIAATMKPDETLLVCAKAFRVTASKYSNITIKKIPQMLLGRCEFGRDDYSLNIKEPVQEEMELAEADI